MNMPDEFANKRQFSRYVYPIELEAPALSEVPLVPKDISAGGFRLILMEKPELEMEIDCAVRIDKDVFHDCRARVSWVRVSESDLFSWNVGFHLILAEERREKLEATLQEVQKKPK